MIRVTISCHHHHQLFKVVIMCHGSIFWSSPYSRGWECDNPNVDPMSTSGVSNPLICFPDPLPWSKDQCKCVQCNVIEEVQCTVCCSAVLYIIQCSVGGTMKDQLESTSGLVRGTHVPPKTPQAPPVTMHSNRHGATTILGITSYFCAAAHI